VLASAPSKIDIKFLGQFPSYPISSEAQGVTADAAATAAVAQQTPEELLESTHRQLETALEQDLLEKVLTVTPTFFEQLVVDLLVTLGYGGSTDNAKRVGRSATEVSTERSFRIH